MHPVLREIRLIETGSGPIRSFARILSLVLIAIALFRSWTIDWAFSYEIGLLVAAGISVSAISYLIPGLLRPVFLVWMSIAVVLGYVMTRILLTLVFILAVTPIGLIMRAFRKDLLNRMPDDSLDTYWLKRNDTDSMGDRMTRYY